MKRVPYEVMVNEFERVLTKYGFEPKDAKASAELFAQNSMAGVYSHGLNRFPRVVEYLKKGEIDPKVKAEKIMINRRQKVISGKMEVFAFVLQPEKALAQLQNRDWPVR